MTEYTSSSQAVREYMTSRERTAYWVRSHTPNENEFYSPSVPPSVIDGLVPSSPPSEVESSHSVPPRMRLRYADGRPDVPLEPIEPTRFGRQGRSDPTFRPPFSPQGSNHRTRTGSHGSSPLSPRRHERSPPSPEEIKVLPSRGTAMPQSSSSSHPPRSRSLPRTADLRSPPEAFVPPLPTNGHPQGSGPQVSFPQHQPWHTYSGRPHPSQKHPPPIVYAPSHHSRSHYAPPQIFHHPPQMGPNGVIYSHSAPVPTTRQPHSGGSIPYPSVPQSSHPLSSVDEERRRGRNRSHSVQLDHDRARSLSAARPIAISPSSSSSSLNTGSRGSGSTYYVLPAAGQKVHVIAPSPQASIATATSTTKSPTSPHFGPFKKPAFFQRLFSWKFSSTESNKGSSVSGGRRLQRRHSTGGSGRRPVVVAQGQ